MSRLLTACVLAVAVLAAPSLARSTHTSREGVTRLRRQVDAGQAKAATVYTVRHVIHASLAGGRRYSVRFRPAQRRGLVSAMLAHHVRFHIVRRARHDGLRRRYIALIGLGILAVLGGIALLVLRRRRPGTPARPAARSTDP